MATVDGMDIAHGGAPALGAQQPQRLGAGAHDRRPRPPLRPGPLPPLRRHPHAGARAAGYSEFGGDVRGGVRGIQAAGSWPLGWNPDYSMLTG